MYADGGSGRWCISMMGLPAFTLLDVGELLNTISLIALSLGISPVIVVGPTTCLGFCDCVDRRRNHSGRKLLAPLIQADQFVRIHKVAGINYAF